MDKHFNITCHCYRKHFIFSLYTLNSFSDKRVLVFDVGSGFRLKTIRDNTLLWPAAALAVIAFLFRDLVMRYVILLCALEVGR